jgi:hypothetical protein
MPDNEDNPADVARFDAIVRNSQLWEELRNAIGAFLGDFAQFESLLLTAMFRGVTTDPVLVEYLSEYVDVHYRLRLLRQLAKAKQLPDVLQREIRGVCKEADKLRECRNDIAHNPPMLFGASLSDPTAPVFAGVQRPRSARHVPHTSATPSAEEIAALQRRWSHDMPTIREWDRIAQQLCAAAHVLANKLMLHKVKVSPGSILPYLRWRCR